MKKLIRFTIFIGAIVLFCGCDQPPVIESSGKNIKIGVIGPFSGSNMAKGNSGLEGIKTAMAMHPLLRNGDGVELVVEDDKNEPELTLYALKKLIEKDGVAGIIILSDSGPVLKIGPLADIHRMPVLAALATHPDTTNQRDFVSQLCFDDNFQGTVAALFVMDELIIEKVAIFSNPENAYSSFLAARFANKFKSIGGEITESIVLRNDTTDYSSILSSIHRKKTELLYLPLGAEEVLQIAKALEEMDWKPEMLGSDGLLTTMLTQYKEYSGLLEGMLSTDFFNRRMPLTSFGKKALKKYRSLYDNPPNSYSVMGGEGYALMFNAIDRCKDPNDRECINRMIRNTVDFTGITGKITIKPNGKATRPLVVNVIKEGKLEFVVKVY